eukprot:6491783-Amphidinium_carterae.3
MEDRTPGPYQTLGENGCEKLVYLGTQIEYEPGCKNRDVILLHQERYTYELMDKFPEYFNDVRQRAVPGSSEGFKDIAEPIDAPLSTCEQSDKVLTAEETRLVKHLQSIGGSPNCIPNYTRHLKAASSRMKELCRYLVYTGPMAADISFMVVLWGPNVLCWKSGRQSPTATSTSEAELFGANHASEALKAMHLVLSEMMGTSRISKKPCGRVWCDNQSAISQILASSSSKMIEPEDTTCVH